MEFVRVPNIGHGNIVIQGHEDGILELLMSDGEEDSCVVDSYRGAEGQE